VATQPPAISTFPDRSNNRNYATRATFISPVDETSPSRIIQLGGLVEILIPAMPPAMRTLPSGRKSCRLPERGSSMGAVAVTEQLAKPGD